MGRNTVKQLFAFASALGDRVNPVAVKEFRQAVQSRWVTSVFMLYLVLNLAIVGGYLMLSPNAAMSTYGGRRIFAMLDTILFLTCLGFVPLYAGIRLALERNDANIDLFFVTAITPGAIVRGKYLTAIALTLLIYSACMPFMMLTYLLRGIDLPTIFLALAWGFAICVAANALGIFAGSISGSWLIRGMVALGVLFLLFQTVTVGFWRVGGPMFVTPFMHSWYVIGTLLLFEALAVGLLYVLTEALLSPKPSNRMLVPRLYITAAWLISGAVLGTWSIVERDDDPMIAWVLCGGVSLMILVVVALGQRDSWSARVRRTIPGSSLFRFPAFLSYTGSAGGMAWYTLLFALTILVGGIWSELELWGVHMPQGEMPEIIGNLTIIFGYVLCYCLTVAALRPVLLRGVNTSTLSVLAGFLAVAVCLVPYLTAFFAQRDYWDSLPWYLIASPMVLTFPNEPAKEAAVPFMIAWLSVAVLAASPWAIGQWRRFKPYRVESEE